MVVFEDSTGNYTRTIAKSGSGLTNVSNPRGITLANNGRIYVVDRGNNRIRVMRTMEPMFAHTVVIKFLMMSGVAVTNDGTFLLLTLVLIKFWCLMKREI